MWQSSIEIEHYSASVKNEFTALIKVLRLPLRRVQVSAIFIASMSSYAHESAFTSIPYIRYRKHTLKKMLTTLTGSHMYRDRDLDACCSPRSQDLPLTLQGRRPQHTKS